MKRLFLFPLLPLLAACSSAPPSVVVQKVNIPVPVSCITGSIAEPDWNMKKITVISTSGEKLKAAFADLELSKGYIGELKAALSACK